jgi:hypothetical protein
MVVDTRPPQELFFLARCGGSAATASRKTMDLERLQRSKPSGGNNHIRRVTKEEGTMGLYPPSSTATTLASLDAAGVAIVQEGEAWFIKFYQYITGPYDTPQAALEASTYWLSANNTKEVAGKAATYRD